MKESKVPIFKIIIIAIFILSMGIFIYQLVTNKSIFYSIESIIKNKEIELSVSSKQIDAYVDKGLSLVERITPLFVSVVPTIYLIKDHKKIKGKKNGSK
jgi:hypothetical protein